MSRPTVAPKTLALSLWIALHAAHAQTVTPQQTSIGFSAAAVGTTTPQTLVAQFTVSAFGSVFTPTATMHYGHDYTVGAPDCTLTGAGTETCSFPITFTPTFPGTRKDAIVLSSGTTTLAKVLVYGLGQGALAAIQPGVATGVAAPADLYDSAVDENGTAYLLASNTNAVYSYTRAGVLTQLPVTGLSFPDQIAIDGAGTLYFAQQAYGNRIATWSADGVQGAITVQPSASYAPCANGVVDGNPVEYLSSVAVDGAGDIFAVEALCSVIFELKPDGTYATFPINPTITQPSRLAVDAAGDVFISGFTINELTAGGVQKEVNALGGMAGSVGDSAGLAVDASGLLYDTPYPGTIGGAHFGVAQLPPSDYSTPELNLDAGAPVNGIGLGSDGTFFAGAYFSFTRIDRSQGALTFGQQNIGVASAGQAVQLVNIGNQPLTLLGIALAGDPGYATQATGNRDCGSGTVLAPSAWCQVAMTLTPAHTGNSTGSLIFTDNSQNRSSGTQMVSLNGYVNGAYVTASPSPLIFAPRQVNTTSPAQTVTLTNDAVSGTANVGTPTSDNPAFVPVSNNCGAGIAPGATCQVLVSFTPGVPGSASGTIAASVSGGMPGETVAFGVSGNGIAPPASLNVAETIRVRDALPALGHAFNLSVAETIHISDALPAFGPAVPLSIAEMIHVRDALPALGRALNLAVTETIHISDALPAFGPVVPLNIAETIHVRDALPALGRVLNLTVAETIHVSDALPALGRALNLTVAETIHVSDALPAFGPVVPLNIAETIHVRDALPALGRALNLAVTETIHVTDDLVVPSVQLTTAVFPAGAGTISPSSGSFAAGSEVRVTATAESGYVFSSFSGAIHGTANPQTLALNSSSTVVANFAPIAPSLSASVGLRTDGYTAGTRNVPITLLNSGAGPATNATVTSIGYITVLTGSGTVTVLSGAPHDLGTVAPAGSATGTAVLSWPATATRVRFTVNFTADGGYSGSTVITSFR